MAAVRAVPQIDNNPETVSDQETRYGYVAYHDIALGSDHKVQPSDSPYHKVLPCRELIPFTNIKVGEINIEKYGEGGTFSKANVAPITVRTKSAAECAREMEQSYQEWAFVVLKPLNGFTAEQAFRIFQVIQPFAYKLGDIEDNLADAPNRIEAIAPYEVSYLGETVEMEPLTPDEQAIAHRILPLIQSSAAQAVKIGNEKVDRTIESMTSRFSGGEGKRTADPHDRYLASEFGQELPKLVTSQTQQAQAAPVQQFVQTESPEALNLKQRELDLRERELIAKEIEMGIRPRPVAETAPMASAPTGGRKCVGTKADGERCGAYAVTDSDYCVNHGK